ncbi:helix-turn-helix domain-containing protein [Paenibacillus sp. LHD-117]|uniref:TetR/AcrR family transcriptional regulator n=1 Tax=Paenibacillus sp. LHD-117 TaxID=3071412 RepID=UPI0027DED003|nr:helix-turn-helix domain-containing protein [Paenibacillus sp. LHD-117]MDQ6418845.1 helix-turn-helix domain-containing protein [Paenibacillus sp. LHD-117]
MDDSKLGSSDRLLLAAINLISERGYNGVTTQEIAAAAGLSEKTLFRHFQSKQNLLEAAFDRYHYAEEMRKLFEEKLVWELEEDLLTICRTYHTTMNRNRKLIQISAKDESRLPGFKERTRQHPLQLLEFLTNYFIAMGDKGKMIRGNPRIEAFTFMMSQYGAFMNDLNAGKNYPNMELEPFMKESVKLFARALTP